MLTPDFYLDLRDRLAAAGYGAEYDWCQSVKAPADPLAFFGEYGWVVVNSGMKNQVAERIWKRIVEALREGRPVSSAFGHPGKATAIQTIWDEREERFAAYLAAGDKLEFLVGLPWIGDITKWHLAKNFGVDCAKPDRHLVRLAQAAGESVDALCARLASATGDRVATVDLILARGEPWVDMNTHYAVITFSGDPACEHPDDRLVGQSPSMSFIACGPEEFCWQALADWTAKHPLAMWEEAEVLARDPLLVRRAVES